MSSEDESTKITYPLEENKINSPCKTKTAQMKQVEKNLLDMKEYINSECVDENALNKSNFKKVAHGLENTNQAKNECKEGKIESATGKYNEQDFRQKLSLNFLPGNLEVLDEKENVDSLDYLNTEEIRETFEGIKIFKLDEMVFINNKISGLIKSQEESRFKYDTYSQIISDYNVIENIFEYNRQIDKSAWLKSKIDALAGDIKRLDPYHEYKKYKI